MASTRFYETSTSGLNFDRFADHFDESAMIRIRQNYWTAKQLIRTKLGKKEDDHLTASDAEFDAKVSLFTSLSSISERMLCCVDDYQSYLADLEEAEVELGTILIEESKAEDGETARSMTALGRVEQMTGRYRGKIRSSLVRFLNELQVFVDRAITDCGETVDAANRSRTEYRGSLLWMKKTSEELNPDIEDRMEKFRTAQSVVRRNKEKFDNLKLDTLQKVDLLAASHCNLFAQLLAGYQRTLYEMFEQTASAYKKIYNLVSAYKHYEFDVLKDLMEPSQKIIQDDSSSQIGQDNDKHLSSNNATGTNEEDVVDLLLDLNLTEEEVNQDEREEESPLGVSGKQDNHLNDSVETTDEKDQTTSVGPLPIAQLPSESVPKLDPPPGWKYSRKNHNEELCPNLVDLLSLEGAEVNSKSFAAEWQLACERTSQLEISNETSSFFGNFPSQLMDISNPTVNSFPNPFASQTMDDQSTAWEQFLSEYDTKEQRRIGEC